MRVHRTKLCNLKICDRNMQLLHYCDNRDRVDPVSLQCNRQPTTLMSGTQSVYDFAYGAYAAFVTARKGLVNRDALDLNDAAS